MNSVWTRTAEHPDFDALKNESKNKQEIKTDVLIIGGGITGILCAYFLQKSGIDYILVEANRICEGITKNTTAKITFQHGLIYDKLINEFGVEKAKLYLESNKSATGKFRTMCKSVDCDFEDKDSFVYSLDSRNKIEKEIKALEKIGFNAEFVQNLPLPFSVAGAVKFSNQAQFHPLKFLYGISHNLNIYENTKVLEFKQNHVITDRGKISAKKIIVATHFPIINKHGAFFLKMYQHRSYVLGLKNAADVNGMYVDESEKGLSFRNYGDMLLLGGGSHRTGKKGGNWEELKDFAERNYPESNEEFRWATQDCMTLDGVPYIGQYSAKTPNLYVATGFNKWGMSSAMVSAMILTDLICGRKNEYAELYSPSRSILRPQLAANIAESIINVIRPTVPRCPHMGCALKYNPHEHSWDCPCHGSRFTDKGKLIDNPATDDMKF